MSIIGSLPEKLMVFCRPLTKITNHWDEMDDTGVPISEYDVRPAFVTDAKNKKTQETARKWAERQTYDYNLKQYVTAQPALVINIDNTADFTKQTKIIGLETRDKNGKVFKVITEYQGHNLYFDLRLDSLLDISVNAGLNKGGIIPCDTVWGRVGSQMKLIRVGSTMHEALVEANKIEAMSNVSTKDLQVGDMFKQKTGSWVVYLGLVDYLDASEENNYSGGYGYNKQYQSTLTVNKIKKQQAWLEIPEVYQKEFDKNNIFGTDRHWYLSYKKSATVKMKIGTVIVPHNWIDLMRAKMIASNGFSNSAYYSKWLNVCRHGDVMPLYTSCVGVAQYEAAKLL